MFDTPLEAGKTLCLNLAPLGPDLPLEHAGEGRYTVNTTVTPLRNAHYDLPVVVQTVEEVRYRFFTATLDVYPAGDLIVYGDAPGEGWTVEATMGESDLTSTAFVRTGSCSYAIGPGTAVVEYVCNDLEGIDLFGYSHLEFYVNGGEGSGQDPIVVDTSRSWLGFVPEADTWTRVSIPASDLTSPLSIIRIRGSVEDPFYLDDMRLVAGEMPTQ